MKNRVYFYILITIVIVILPQLVILYKFRILFANSQREGDSFNLVEETQKHVKSDGGAVLYDKNTQRYQTIPINSPISRLTLISDKLFLQIKKIHLKPNVTYGYLSNSVMSWISYMRVLLIGVREQIAITIMGYLSNTSMRLITDMVFGQVYPLTTSEYHNLKVTGMLHVVAASGFNIGLVTLLANLISARFGRFEEFLIWIVIVGMYTLMTDLSISITRAFLMMVLKKAGSSLFLRSYHNLYTLAITFLILLLFDSAYITNISFQLSMGATIGIIVFTPFFGIEHPAIENDQITSLWKIVKENMATTIAAQILTLPIILYHFSELSLLSFFSNVALLWMTPFLTLGGISLYGVGFISQWMPVGSLLTIGSVYLELLSTLFLRSVELLGMLELFFIENIHFTLNHVIFYLVITTVTYIFFYTKHAKNKNKAFPYYRLNDTAFDLDYLRVAR